MGRPPEFESNLAIEKAVTVFWRDGYAATTPQGLADELGIGKGSLYNTFKSKQNLFALALRQYSLTRKQMLTQILNGTGPTRRHLQNAMGQLIGLDTHRQGCFIVNTIATVADDAAAIAVANDLFADIATQFGAAIRDAQRNQEISPDKDADKLADSLLATVIGTSLLSKSGTSHARLKQIIEVSVEKL